MGLGEVKPDGLEMEGFLEKEVILEVMTGNKTTREREAERKTLFSSSLLQLPQS